MRSLKQYIKSRILSWLGYKAGRTQQNLNREAYPVCNLNQDARDKNQKRLAFVYILSALDQPIGASEVYHPNILRQTVMLQTLCQCGYVIDFYSCSDCPIGLPEEEYTNKYDVILGFGTQYVQLCKTNPKAKKILFITENAPWVVREKYEERVDYFRTRHPEIVLTDSPRTDFYTDEMYKMSDAGIAVTGSYNVSGMWQRLSHIERLNGNGLYNPNYKPNNIKNHEETRKRFVWFGSRGFVHKGLDILIDAFAELPELHMDVYGISRREMNGIVIPENVDICDSINVMSDAYLTDVVNRCSFAISLSCSEGMQSGITTCMMHGLIPIVTKECGYNDQKNIMYFDGFDMESVKATLLKASRMPVEAVKEQEQKVHAEAIQTFSLDNFAQNFKEAIKSQL